MPPSHPSSLGTALSSVRAVSDERASVLTEPAPPRPPDAPPPAGTKGDERPSHPLAFLRELPVLLLVAFLLALIIKTFVVQAFFIPSQSMERTLQVGDRVLVNKIVYHLHPPRRGDVIVFEDPNPEPHAPRSVLAAVWDWLTEGLGVSASAEKDFIKRVIALPGETIEIRQGVVFVDGRELNEPYVGRLADTRDYPKTTVPADHLFVMGDNRPNSNDSRFSLGFIPEDRVIGRAFVLVWPPSRIGWLH
ncbi:MAG: signal peptidase I [Actinobacteria bacterium]|nr:signal peptidase I [Actinomycetota bacterium]